MKRLGELPSLDLLYGVAVSTAVYVDLWQYGVPSYTALVGLVSASVGVVSGAALGRYRGNLSSRTELTLFALFAVTAVPLLHVTSSAALGLTLVTGTWTAIAVERLRDTET